MMTAVACVVLKPPLDNPPISEPAHYRRRARAVMVLVEPQHCSRVESVVNQKQPVETTARKSRMDVTNANTPYTVAECS